MLFQDLQLLEKKLSYTLPDMDFFPLALSQGSLCLFVPMRPDFSNLNFSCRCGICPRPTESGSLLRCRGHGLCPSLSSVGSKTPPLPSASPLTIPFLLPGQWELELASHRLCAQVSFAKAECILEGFAHDLSTYIFFITRWLAKRTNDAWYL